MVVLALAHKRHSLGCRYVLIFAGGSRGPDENGQRRGVHLGGGFTSNSSPTKRNFAHCFAHIADAMERLSTSIGDALGKVDLSKNEQKLAAFVGAGAVSLGLYYLLAPSSSYKKKPSTLELSGGTIDRKQIKAKFDDYAQSYGEAIYTPALVRYSHVVWPT